jgi:pimeloyl-ACP methyl ester carboxylesterase
VTRTTSSRGHLAASIGLALCVLITQPIVRADNTPPTLPAPACRSTVIVVDGAGGFEAASRHIHRAAAEDQLPLDVRVFHWSHGFCRILADQVHAEHARQEAKKLADAVETCRCVSQHQPIFLVGHSAGCAVVLLAAEKLPPDSVERIVLLAPAVSAKRDLKPGLRCARQGIDVFTSTYDWAWLGLGTLLAGTADRHWTLATAGRAGFQPRSDGEVDDALYAKLRQYPWNSRMKSIGHNGGHYGAYQPDFLRAFVLPLLCTRDGAK